MSKSFEENEYSGLIKKILITLLIICIYKLMTYITLPGIDPRQIIDLSLESNFLKFINKLSGGGIDKFSILAINTLPYINATMITQILCSKLGIKEFQELKKNRESGGSKLNNYTKLFTVVIGFFNSFYLCHVMANAHIQERSLIFIGKNLFYMINIPLLICGSFITIWLSSLITKHGVANGGSILVLVNLLSLSPISFDKLLAAYRLKEVTLHLIILIGLFYFVLICISLFIELCYRKIKVKSLDTNEDLPLNQIDLRINNVGVLSLTTASILIHFPQLLITILKNIGFSTYTCERYIAYFSIGGKYYFLIYGIFVVFMTLLQSDIVFDPEEISKALQDMNVVLVGIRPGKTTNEHLKNIINKLNIISALYLVTICISTEYYMKYINSILGQNVINISGSAIVIGVGITKSIADELSVYDYNKILQKHGAKD